MKLKSILFPLSAVFLGIVLVACEQSANEQKAPTEDSTKGTATSLEVIDVDAAEADKLITGEPELVILDVRTPEEFKDGHLKNAVNIDFKNENFETEIEKLDPDKTYLIHCRSGNRSGQSLPVFEKLNFTKLYHLTPGYNGWVEAGNEVVK